MKEVYFDNAATTKPLPIVLDKSTECFSDFYGNPSSLHNFGLKAEMEIKKAAKKLAQILNCDYERLIFTSGGTESNNLAILGGAGFLHNKTVAVAGTEHPSVLECYRYLEKNGFKVIWLPVSESGQIDLEYFQNIISDIFLVSILHVNNETGEIQDLESIAKIRKSNPKALLHIDAVQSFCKLDIDVKKLGVDLLSISSHKIHGLKGTGALYVRNGVNLKPMMYGGGQQKNIRPGTENSFGIIAFAHAAEFVYGKKNEIYERVRRIRDYILEYASEDSGIVVNSSDTASPYVLNLSFLGAKSEVLLHAFEEYGIYISSGAACSSRNKKHSVLRACGKPGKIADSSIRLSFSCFNVLEDAVYFVETAKKIMSKLILIR